MGAFIPGINPIILNNIGAVAILLYGIGSLIAPERMGAFLHFTPDDARGSAEFRLGIGGFFTAMGIATLVLQEPAAFQVQGWGWAAAAVIRNVALFIDRPDRSQQYFMLFVFEVFMAIFMLA